MRRVAVVFLATVLVGVVAFVLLGVLRQSDDAFSLNVPQYGVAAELPAGSTFCQDKIAVPIGGAFNGGRLPIGTDGRRGPQLEVLLADRRGRPIARTTIPGGYADNSSQRFRFDRTIADGRGLQLCVTNVGDVPASFYGSGGDPNPSTSLTVEKTPQGADVAIVFERPTRSTLANAGDILARAALFRTPRLSGAVYGLLLLVLLGTAVASIAFALRAAYRDDQAADPDSDEDDSTVDTVDTETLGHRGGW